MPDEQVRLQIGEFAEMVGLSVPQLRRYDRLQLLAPKWRSQAGYRHYSTGQTGAGRVIALLRSMDMPIADIRRVLAGIDEDERQQLFRDHRARLEARLDEVRSLLYAVDLLTMNETNIMKDTNVVNASTDISAWLHVMPHLPVSDIDRSVNYYQEALGFRVAWQTTDKGLTALASGAIDVLLLVPWTGDRPTPAHSHYVYVENPDSLCTEYEQAGATIVDAVASRDYGMRDFVVSDPDGHRFTLGRGEERLREVAGRYGLDREEMAINPTWPQRRHATE